MRRHRRVVICRTFRAFRLSGAFRETRQSALDIGTLFQEFRHVNQTLRTRKSLGILINHVSETGNLRAFASVLNAKNAPHDQLKDQ
ncbi:MAG: hypothetical protein AAFU41_17035 [Pseudomonadota bacterium]